MTELQTKAIAKIDAEIEKNKGNRAYEVIGEYLINLVTAQPQAAEKLLDEKKNLAGAYKAMETEARKNAKNGCAVLTDEDGFAIVCDYFGVDEGAAPERGKPVPASEPKPALDVDLDDLLG